MRPVRLLGLDLDGTVLTDDKRVTDRTMAAMLDAAHQGCEVVLVTGRPLHGIPEEFTAHPEFRYIIASNGAVTVDRAENREIHGNFLDPELVLQLVRIPVREKVVYSVFLDGYGWCEEDAFLQMKEFFRPTSHYSYILQSRRSVKDITEFIRRESREGSRIENFWIMAGSVENRDRILEMVGKPEGVNIFLTAAYDFEIVSASAEKGRELLWLGGQLGIPPKDMMTIGDNVNDLGMLKSAGLSVAMANAEESVRAAARFVTKSNEEDGAALAIERFVLDRGHDTAL